MIEVSGLTKLFGSVRAVDDLAFSVDEGKVVGFLGPNGAGKTTTLRMLLGLVAPTSGRATVNGLAYRELPDPLHVVGAALEASSFHPGRTGAARIDEVLDLVDLADAADRRVGGYSLGMRQRLGLATALLHDPDVLILDEPANGLDPEGVRWLRTLLRDLGDEGHTVLVSSHILAEVAQTVDSIVILDRGRLVTQASLDQLVGDVAPLVRVRTSRPDHLRDLLVADGADVTVTDAGWLDVSGASPERIGTLAAEQAVPIFETRVESLNLEDVFFQLTSREPAR